MLPVLNPHPECRNCDLWETCTNIGIGTRLIQSGPENGDTALLIVGDCPGVVEDTLNAHFTGPSGRLLESVYLRSAGLSRFADIYVTNAVRCCPPKDVKPTQGQYKQCHAHLVEDVATLAAQYRRVVILGAGAGASRSLISQPLEKALYQQGRSVSVGAVSVPVFWTSNPAALMKDRAPEEAANVADHLNLLVTYLETGNIPTRAEVPTLEWNAVSVGEFVPDLLSLDFETYGCIEGLPKQTVFQPTRSLVTDQCRRNQLIQTAAVSWRTPDGLRTAVYNMQTREGRKSFRALLDYSWKRGCRTLLGMNIPFDVMFLRAAYPWGRTFNHTRWKLIELGVINYLFSEVRPERSLKNLSKLLMVADYDEELNLKTHRYPSVEDSRLYDYNAKDTVATLVNYESLVESIRRDYPETDKLSPACYDHYNRLLWWAMYASERGVTIDSRVVAEIQGTSNVRADRLRRYAQTRWQGKLDGKGVKGWYSAVMEEALILANLHNDRRVKRTPKTKEISAGDENFNLLLGNLDPYCESARKVRCIQRFKTLRDTVSRYTRPLLVGRKVKGQTELSKASCLLTDTAYPTWYVIPSQFEDTSSGGTKQGRITCRNPGLLNLSKPLKRTLWTRFSPGVLCEGDESQIELRTAALVSGDPLMLEDYRLDRDIHLTTGLMILREMRDYMKTGNLNQFAGVERDWLEQLFSGPTATKDTPGVKTWRQLGKTVNFAVLFKAGARKLMETAARDNKLLLPVRFWQKLISAYYSDHKEFGRWQEQWIKSTVATRYAALPVLGQSRLFVGGVRGTQNKINEISNFPIQTLAADTLIDASWWVEEEFRARDMAAMSNLKIYDSMLVECPKAEYPVVEEVCLRHLRDVPFWHQLEQHYGRTCPLDAEVKILTTRA